MNLIEVMIAAGLVAGIALVVASYLSTSHQQSKGIVASAECQSRLNSISAEIKARNNNRTVMAWLPNSTSLDPRGNNNDLLASYMDRNILDTTQVNTNIPYTGSPVIFPNNTGDSFRSVLAENFSIAQNAHNNQLVFSAMNLVSSHYPSHCSDAGDLRLINAASGGDYLEAL